MNRDLRVIWYLALGLCLAGGWGCSRQSPPISAAIDDDVDAEAMATIDKEAIEQLAELKPEKRDHANSGESTAQSTTEAATESTSDASTGNDPADVWLPRGSWTTQRLVALAETGPIVIDLAVNIGGLSLREANARLLARTAAELLSVPPATNPIEATAPEPPLATAERSIAWEQLLALPLVQSGWLGNLVASSEQTGQLIDQYDIDRDAVVSTQELHHFLSRGLERSAALQVIDIGEAPDRQPDASPWSSGDRNQDHTLDANERDQFAETLSNRDLNADGVITTAEWAEPNGDATQMATMNGTSRNSFLRSQTLLILEPLEEGTRLQSINTQSEQMQSHTAQASRDMASRDMASRDMASRDKAARKLANNTMRHYTFLAELSRSQWMGWSDEQWQAIDSNQDQMVDQRELQLLANIPPQATIYLSWPGSEPAETDKASRADAPINTVQVHGLATDPKAAWHDRLDGGTLVCGDFSLNITAVDGFSPQAKLMWRQQLSQALQNPQFKTLISSRLELQPDAFEVLDVDQDQQLSDAEFARAWQWISVRQSARVMSQWMLSSQPVFQLLDFNGDGRLSQAEIGQLSPRFVELDRNDDGTIAPNELPLVVSLRASRSDRRLETFASAGPASETANDTDWFSAMDTNRDGNINRSEFLGDASDFERLDLNLDGFVSRAEGLANSQ